MNHADLILSEQNPLESIKTLKEPAAVVKQGRFFTNEELGQLRNKAIEDRGFWQELNTLRKA